MEALLDDAIVMPMDGYHHPVSVLESFPNPVDAIYRRGAPDTFDPASLEKDLERIVNGDETTVSIPGFDHARGDPEPNQHTFDRSKHKIVICEGIYLMHDSDGWENIKDYMDFNVYIIADIDVCVNRLKERNKCIPGYSHGKKKQMGGWICVLSSLNKTLLENVLSLSVMCFFSEEIELRCDAVDRVNAQLVEASRRYATEEVYSNAAGVVNECDIENMDVEKMIEEAELETPA